MWSQCTLTFKVVDAFNNYFGYVEGSSNNIFLANSNEFAIIYRYGSGDVNDLIIEADSGEKLGTYIDRYKNTDNVKYYYNGNYHDESITYYNLWNIEDTSMSSCFSMVPAVWDKTFDSNTIIDTDTTYTVLALGTAYTCIA